MKISIPTANRYLRGLGLLGRIAKRVNYHSGKHISRRQFCNSVKTWDLHKWRQVVFTDEVRIKMESRRRIFVRRPFSARNKARYCIKWKYNHRRSQMFWGLICADGRRELVCCKGSMNSVKYCSILQRYLKNTWKKCCNKIMPAITVPVIQRNLCLITKLISYQITLNVHQT